MTVEEMFERATSQLQADVAVVERLRRASTSS
jgi:hypothetical protein